MTQVAERPPGAAAAAEHAAGLSTRPAAASAQRRRRSSGGSGWLLCAPAAHRDARGRGVSDRLRDLSLTAASRPALPGRQRSSSGFDNYVSVLTSSLWWTDLGTTVVITVISVAIELVLGMALALVMHRALVGRGLVRTTILVPYGIITVVAALAWKFAFTPGTGFVNSGSARDRGLAHRARNVALRDHRHRGVEDDAVHGAAAARRPRARYPTT